MEITEFSNVIKVLSDVRPDYLYNLAAQSFVVDSFRHPIITNQINYVGVLNILECIRILKLDTKIFQPSTCEMYGDQPNSSANELTTFNPSNPYGLSKFAAYKAINIYRESHNIRACSAILFNHESEIRGREFVTRKITGQLASLKVKDAPPLQLGNLSASRDWGYANDYIDAITMIMADDVCDDYVVATNKLNTVRSFFSLVALNMGFDPKFEGDGLDEKCFDSITGKLLCEVKSDFFRERDTKALKGDFTKINECLGWEPRTSFEQLAEIMSIRDLEREKSI
jgi:GDPmannose 4,6-dehydratase